VKQCYQEHRNKHYNCTDGHPTITMQSQHRRRRVVVVSLTKGERQAHGKCAPLLSSLRQGLERRSCLFLQIENTTTAAVCSPCAAATCGPCVCTRAASSGRFPAPPDLTLHSQGCRESPRHARDGERPNRRSGKDQTCRREMR
jgi:hypothetical protein